MVLDSSRGMTECEWYVVNNLCKIYGKCCKLQKIYHKFVMIFCWICQPQNHHKFMIILMSNSWWIYDENVSIPKN